MRRFNRIKSYTPSYGKRVENFPVNYRIVVQFPYGEQVVVRVSRGSNSLQGSGVLMRDSVLRDNPKGGPVFGDHVQYFAGTNARGNCFKYAGSLNGLAE